MILNTVPEASRSDMVTRDAREYDPDALLAEIVIRFEHAGLLPKDRRLPDPRGAHDAAALLLTALGLRPVDLGMQKRIARRVAALGGVR
jgi:hypothetical protein